MPDRIARLRFELKEWTGWSREQPSPYTNTVEARLGQVLELAEFGIPAEYVPACARIYRCRVRIMTLLADRLFLEYQHLTVRNPGGGINLSGPFAGTVLLRSRQRVELATPTMDGGLILTVAVDAILDAESTVPA